VDAGVEDVPALAEGRGGAVAVMDVPIHDQHPAQPELADRKLRGAGDAVEQAKAHRPVTFGVMAGGADGAEPERGLAAGQRPRHGDGCAHGVQGGAVGGPVGKRVRVEAAAAPRAEVPEGLDVGAVVDQLELLLARGRPLPALPAQPVVARQLELDRR
jgi:hypothetical protein